MNNDDLERDLRRVLSDPGHRLPDRLVPLERVHAGATHRRRRHQAVTASLAVLAVVGIGLGVARPWATGDSDGTGVAAATSSANPTSPSSLSSAPSVTDSPSVDTSSASATSPSAGLDPARIIREFDESQPTSVTAISDQKWWVSNPSTILATSDDGRSFTVASHEFDPGFDDGYFVAVRFVDPTHGTALLHSRSLTSTVDGGKTWKPVGNGASSFFALEAGGTKTTYALQQGADSGIHLWSQVGTGPWKDVATLNETATPGPLNVQLAVQGDRAVVVWRTSKAVVSASFDSAGTSSGPTNVTGCAFVLGLTILSSGRGAVWLSCPTGNSDVVVTSTDLGATWHGVSVPGDAGHHILGAIDATHAVITTSDGLGVLGTDGTLKKATIPEGSAAAMSTYIGFTNPTHGFALADRQLLRSTDGGLTWKAVFYAG